MTHFTTTVEDEHGVEHDVVVTYNFTKPRPATYFEPEEGGCEIEDIVSPIRLTQQEQERIEQECIDYAWDVYREGASE